MAIAKMKEYDFNKLLHMQPCKLGHNTWLRGEIGEKREIIYHASPIITLDPDKKCVITNTHGYSTITTTGRIHEFLVRNGLGKCGIRKGLVVYNTMGNAELLSAMQGLYVFDFDFVGR